jgi:tRNA threonylcarbamoyladenosine biosynthesis protein TsaE
MEMAAASFPPFVKCLPSVSATAGFAADLAGVLRSGDLLLFTGGIGSGKTTFIQALAKSLGVAETVTSPTFVLHATYESGRIPLSHVDLYRLNSDAEVESFGFEDYLDTAVTAVEWADRYSCFQPPNIILDFAFGALEDDRILSVLPNGGDWLARLSEIWRRQSG